MSAPRLGRVAPVPFPGRPGRPRRAETLSTPAPRPARTVTTDPPGTPAAAPSRRLLTLADAARYLGVSVWTARAFEAQGILRRVRIPLPNGGELRKLLFDVNDLDRAIAAWKT